MTLPIEPPLPDAELFPLYEQAINGERSAITELGDAYSWGQYGVTPNLKLAFRLYEQSAELGDPRALLRLGNLYGGLYGGGDPIPAHDFTKSRQYYEKAAELGDVGGILGLADYCYRGVAAPVDLPRARALFRAAADKGSIGAMGRLAHLLDKALGGTPDYGEAAILYLRVASGGNAHTQRYLVSGYTDAGKYPLHIETRKEIQKELQLKQLYLGAIDGVFGEMTHSALRAYIGPFAPSVTPDVIEALKRMERDRVQASLGAKK